MKKVTAILSLFLLMISCSACKNPEQKSEDIHSEIHTNYYTVGSYTADCAITAYTTGGENTYECIVDYNKDDSSYRIFSEDMSISLTNDKTVITKGENTIESVPSDTDMYIFINTFFESYYESEDTTVSAGSNADSRLTLLECSCVRPTEIASSMKLWIDNETVLPVKMQVFNSDSRMTSEIIFRSFKFI